MLRAFLILRPLISAQAKQTLLEQTALLTEMQRLSEESIQELQKLASEAEGRAQTLEQRLQEVEKEIDVRVLELTCCSSRDRSIRTLLCTKPIHTIYLQGL
jgi:hypothetical protein